MTEAETLELSRLRQLADLRGWMLRRGIRPGEPEPMPPARPNIGALEAWWARLRRDPASRDVTDDLYRAACYEMAAVEAHRDGFYESAERLAGKSRAIVARHSAGAA